MDKQEQGVLRQQPELEGPRGRWHGQGTGAGGERREAAPTPDAVPGGGERENRLASHCLHLPGFCHCPLWLSLTRDPGKCHSL